MRSGHDKNLLWLTLIMVFIDFNTSILSAPGSGGSPACLMSLQPHTPACYFLLLSFYLSAPFSFGPVTRRGHQILQIWSYRFQLRAMWYVFGLLFELGPSGRAANALNCQSIIAPRWLNLNCKVPLPYKTTWMGSWKPLRLTLASQLSFYNSSRSLGFPSGRIISLQVGLSTTLPQHPWLLFLELGDIPQENKEGNHTFPHSTLQCFYPNLWY